MLMVQVTTKCCNIIVYKQKIVGFAPKKNSCFCKPFGTKRKSLETKKNTVSTCGVASTRRSLNIGRVVYRLGGITAEKILYPTTFVSQKNLHFFCRFTIGPSTHLGCSFGARVPIAAHQQVTSTRLTVSSVLTVISAATSLRRG